MEMNSKLQKRLFSTVIVFVLCVALTASAFAATSNGSTRTFSPDGYNYSAYNFVTTVTSPSGAYAGGKITCTNFLASRPACYLQIHAVLFNVSGSILRSNIGTNNSSASSFSLTTATHYGSGGYYAQGMAGVWTPNYNYYSELYLGDSPHLYV